MTNEKKPVAFRKETFDYDAGGNKIVAYDYEDFNFQNDPELKPLFAHADDSQNEALLREALQKLVQAVGGKLEADDKFKRCVSEARAALLATEPSPTL